MMKPSDESSDWAAAPNGTSRNASTARPSVIPNGPCSLFFIGSPPSCCHTGPLLLRQLSSRRALAICSSTKTGARKASARDKEPPPARPAQVQQSHPETPSRLLGAILSTLLRVLAGSIRLARSERCQSGGRLRERATVAEQPYAGKTPVPPVVLSSSGCAGSPTTEVLSTASRAPVDRGRPRRTGASSRDSAARSPVGRRAASAGRRPEQ